MTVSGDLSFTTDSDTVSKVSVPAQTLNREDDDRIPWDQSNDEKIRRQMSLHFTLCKRIHRMLKKFIKIGFMQLCFSGLTWICPYLELFTIRLKIFNLVWFRVLVFRLLVIISYLDFLSSFFTV